MTTKMKSLAYTPLEKTLEADVVRTYPSGPDYPTLYVDSKQMSEIDEWEVGTEYELVIKVKMTSYSVSDEGDQRSRAVLSVESYEREAEKSLD